MTARGTTHVPGPVGRKCREAVELQGCPPLLVNGTSFLGKGTGSAHHARERDESIATHTVPHKGYGEGGFPARVHLIAPLARGELKDF